MEKPMWKSKWIFIFCLPACNTVDRNHLRYLSLEILTVTYENLIKYAYPFLYMELICSGNAAEMHQILYKYELNMFWSSFVHLV